MQNLILIPTAVRKHHLVGQIEKKTRVKMEFVQTRKGKEQRGKKHGLKNEEYVQ